MRRLDKPLAPESETRARRCVHHLPGRSTRAPLTARTSWQCGCPGNAFRAHAGALQAATGVTSRAASAAVAEPVTCLVATHVKRTTLHRAQQLRAQETCSHIGVCLHRRCVKCSTPEHDVMLSCAQSMLPFVCQNEAPLSFFIFYIFLSPGCNFLFFLFFLFFLSPGGRCRFAALCRTYLF